ncbi:hypothetical protein HNR19_004289 [Nocardioides thalensis]|uniref:Putative membrane protein insertion efficiency factor n=1 Tax=Nocardioides thalensis TaxID=1914755 RepID=A0A853C8V2_9ACTN|nr:hypothetical protein [Nocardioides thalensis]
MKWVLIGLVRVYQFTLSPLLGQVCRYYPSCSHYAVEALDRHGAIKGSWLTVRRLGRCHPWAPGGVDHVPPRVPPLRTASAGAATKPAATNPDLGV